MIRTIDTDLLCSVPDIAAEAGVTSAAVSNWQRRYSDFPTPIYSNGERIKLWYWPEVTEWLLTHNVSKWSESVADVDTNVFCGILDIASLAGVGQPAVSNWSKRHADFPRALTCRGRIGGTLVKLWYWSEVSSWLYQNGKI
jgi:predicted DNA-binding transcriptional regulator AlpA